jgi:uncharacterized integral membrane protein
MVLRKRDTAKRETPERRHYAGTGVWPAVVTGLVLGTAVVVFVAQNMHLISLHFLWLDFRTSPAVLVLVTALLSVAGSVIVGAGVRRRRRRMLQEREELERLRRTVASRPEPPAAPAPAPEPEASIDGGP